MILEAAYMDDGSDERSSCPNIPFARRPHRVRSKVFDLSYAMSWSVDFKFISLPLSYPRHCFQAWGIN